jgi:hypothetical protein
MSKSQENTSLPLFYKEILPLNSNVHATSHSRTTDKASWLVKQHAVPLTTEEFAKAQRSFPIIFSASEKPVPLALMGLNEGVNVFLDAEGGFDPNLYIPAYVRRYPFLLARLNPESEDLSLCFDPTSDLVGAFDEGDALFSGEEPSERCKSILGFCERFEIAGKQTTAFVELLEKHDLLADGEFTIQPDGGAQPSVYRGFKMVTDEKLRALSPEILAELNASGALALIHLHQASLGIITEIFARQAKVA